MTEAPTVRRWAVTVRGFSETPTFLASNAKAAKMLAWKAVKEAGYAYGLPDFMAAASARPAGEADHAE